MPVLAFVGAGPKKPGEGKEGIPGRQGDRRKHFSCVQGIPLGGV